MRPAAPEVSIWMNTEAPGECSAIEEIFDLARHRLPAPDDGREKLDPSTLDGPEHVPDGALWPRLRALARTLLDSSRRCPRARPSRPLRRRGIESLGDRHYAHSTGSRPALSTLRRSAASRPATRSTGGAESDAVSKEHGHSARHT